MENLVNFKEFEPHIVGSYEISDWFSFVIYTDKAPYESDTIVIGEKKYTVHSIIDATTDDEYQQGLSYSKVWLVAI
jgi:hypothetical protein